MRVRVIPRGLIADPSRARFAATCDLKEYLEHLLGARGLWTPRLLKLYQESRDELLKHCADYSNRFAETPQNDAYAFALTLRYAWTRSSRPRSVERFLKLRRSRIRGRLNRFAALLRHPTHHPGQDAAQRWMADKLDLLLWKELTCDRQLLELLHARYSYTVSRLPDGLRVESTSNRRKSLVLREAGNGLLQVQVC